MLNSYSFIEKDKEHHLCVVIIEESEAAARRILSMGIDRSDLIFELEDVSDAKGACYEYIRI